MHSKFMQKINSVDTHYLKVTTAIFALGFLISIFKVSSLILLCATCFLSYLTGKRIYKSIVKKGFKHYVPQKWKKEIGNKTLIEFFCDSRVMEKIPILSVLTKSLFAQDLAIIQRRRAYQIRQLTETECQLAPGVREVCGEQSFFNGSSMVGEQSMVKERKRLMEPTTEDSARNYEERTLSKRNSFITHKKFVEESSSESCQKQTLGSRRNPSRHHLPVSKQEYSKGEIARQANPLKTFEEYLKALMWMMKRLLGLKKMTNQIQRTSTLKITLITSFFWVVIALQIKMDSKKGKVLLKSLHVISSVLSILGVAGASSILVYKLYRQVYPLPSYHERKRIQLERGEVKRKQSEKECERTIEFVRENLSTNRNEPFGIQNERNKE